MRNRPMRGRASRPSIRTIRKSYSKEDWRKIYDASGKYWKKVKLSDAEVKIWRKKYKHLTIKD